MYGFSIEKLVAPDERIIKKQERVTAPKLLGMPAGDLYLTDKQLLFLSYTLGLPPWSPIPAEIVVPLAPLQITFPLHRITSIGKGFFGSLKIMADRKYEFGVGIWKASDWADAILQARADLLSRLRQQKVRVT